MADAPVTNGDSVTAPKRLPVSVTKPIPYTFDLGNLLCTDANPVGSASSLDEELLHATARDCAQGLINQLLSTCAIGRSSDGTSMSLTLPPGTTPLPREKPVPAAKPLTRWQEFAAKKGITPKKRDGKLVYDEVKGEWVPKYGYKGKNKDGEGDWLVEVDDKKEARTGEAGDARKEKRQERIERIRRQERRERANERRGKK
ncbi:ribosomal biogenesis regulatory protein [Myriangium duriaei CBS 260.36]|uniref:Ribosome biogenesis regulatory protein n=1 Tax=Myriangium duriaei CBS 260.36 TaxID=1168546 RepID=A0A9P4MJ60_9PEZI|nr:ribosomal biogenesis regulatory protein [Myriangium duriaei CBS 260.36]